MADITIEHEIEQLKRELGVELDRELAAYLRLDPSTVAGWRRRGSIPEKYRLRLAGRADERSREGLQLADFIGLKDAYIFALIREVVLAYPEAGFGLPGYEATYFGFRLANLYAYLERYFRAAEPNSLREMYEEMAKEIAEADIPVWIETKR